jgi:hypothetical protein
VLGWSGATIGVAPAPEVTAYKFLRRGAIDPDSRAAWPQPGVAGSACWVTLEGPLAVCVRGVHVCRASDLAHWVGDELWVAETGHERLEGLDCVVVRRARLVRRVDGWSENGASRFALACVDHAAGQLQGGAGQESAELLRDARLSARAGQVASSALCAALAVARDADSHEVAYRAERAWQSAWIAGELLD